MKKLNELIALCKDKNLSCSFTYQKINDYSVEIYTGYVDSYKNLFYTDGHVKPKKAINKALKFLNK